MAVSGSNSTGKTTLCKVLSMRLNWKHVTVGGEIRKLAEEFNFNIEEFGSLPDEILIEVDNRMRERMTTEKNTIWDSRLSCYLSKDFDKIFKVLCVANINVRTLRSSKRDKISVDDARKLIYKRESEESAVFKRLYGLSNPFNEKWMDLIIDTSYLTPEELAQKVITVLELSI